MSDIDRGRALIQRINDGAIANDELAQLLVAVRDECVAQPARGQDAADDCAHVAAIRYGIGTERARALIEAHDEQVAEDAAALRADWS